MPELPDIVVYIERLTPLILGQPVGFSGLDELFERIEIPALHVVIDGREPVVRGGDDFCTGFADAMEFASRPRRIGADGKRIAHRQQKVELLGGHLLQIDDVPNHQGRSTRPRAHRLELPAYLFDHGG